jgi:hypothetical protein
MNWLETSQGSGVLDGGREFRIVNYKHCKSKAGLKALK